MSKSATFVRHKAKPGRRDEVRRIWEKYAATMSPTVTARSAITTATTTTIPI